MSQRFQFSLRDLLLTAIPAGLAFCLIPPYLHDDGVIYGRPALAFWVGLLGCASVCIILLSPHGGRRLSWLAGGLLVLITFMALTAQMTPG